MEGIISKTVITLETAFKSRYIAGCAYESVINADGIIPTPLGFMMSVSVIQALSVFRSIMNIGNCQAPLPIMGLLAAHTEEEALTISELFQHHQDKSIGSNLTYLISNFS